MRLRVSEISERIASLEVERESDWFMGTMKFGFQPPGIFAERLDGSIGHERV
jgi:hypothetical protein